eukprot:768626-Hanusia_phi.AAC.7
MEDDQGLLHGWKRRIEEAVQQDSTGFGCTMNTLRGFMRSSLQTTTKVAQLPKAVARRPNERKAPSLLSGTNPSYPVQRLNKQIQVAQESPQPPQPPQPFILPQYFCEGAPLPLTAPRHFKMEEERVKFDPGRHLDVCKEIAVSRSHGSVYTKPFRLLSEEGVQVLRQVIATNELHAKEMFRSPKCLRGLGYRSPFVRDLSTHRPLLDLLSSLAGEPISLHAHGMNLGSRHTNFGEVGGVAAEKWHVDSVDYVLIVMLSDTEGMEGGDLQLYLPQGAADAQTCWDKLSTNSASKDDILSLKFPSAGYATLVQGSKIFHTVSPLLAAKGPRVTLVNSYTSNNVFKPDSTRFSSYKDAFLDPPDVVDLEFSRHRAARAMGQLEHILVNATWDTPAAELASVFHLAGQELMMTSRLLRGEEKDMLSCNTAENKTIGGGGKG